MKRKTPPEFEIKLNSNITVTPIRSFNAMREARRQRRKKEIEQHGIFKKTTTKNG